MVIRFRKTGVSVNETAILAVLFCTVILYYNKLAGEYLDFRVYAGQQLCDRINGKEGHSLHKAFWELDIMEQVFPKEEFIGKHNTKTGVITAGRESRAEGGFPIKRTASEFSGYCTDRGTEELVFSVVPDYLDFFHNKLAVLNKKDEKKRFSSLFTLSTRVNVKEKLS